MSTETTWTAEDNCSAFEQTTITHVNRIEELELQVERLDYSITDIPGSGGLDHIIVYWRDVGLHKGYVTITCWGCAWTAYFGGMGDHNIRSFFAMADTGYLAGKLSGTQWLKQSKKHESYLEKLVDAVKAALSALTATHSQKE